MNNITYRSLGPVLLLVLLTACGGGSDNPVPTPLSASLTVSSATSTGLNGVYSTNAVGLAAVEKINPVGGDPEVCSFRFSGLAKTGGGSMDGDIRYLPGTNALRSIFISISGLEFVSRDTTNAAVDRANNRINLTGKVLTASTGVASTITVTGSVPMRGDRPEGC
jgi:hypothetical protein